MPPPAERMRDRRARRPGEEVRRELERELDQIDDALRELYEEDL